MSATILDVLGPSESALPRLQSLSLGPVVCSTQSCLPDKAPRKHWAAFLHAAAVRQALTSLSFSCHKGLRPLPWPEAFPHLLDLTINCEPGQAARDFSAMQPDLHQRVWSRLPSLTRLSFSLNVNSTFGLGSLPPAQHHWLPFRADTISCPELRVLLFSIQIRDAALIAEAEALWRKASPGIISNCPRLECLELQEDIAGRMPNIIASHVSRLASLTGLKLSSACTVNEKAGSWDSFPEALRHVVCLKRLSLGPLNWVSYSWLQQLCDSLACAGGLEELQLEQLQMGKGTNWMDAGFERLASLTKLCVNQLLWPVKHLERLLQVLVVLPRLQVLAIQNCAELQLDPLVAHGWWWTMHVGLL
eukprot:jgi/Ulvmu1/11408/UM075_0070.1